MRDIKFKAWISAYTGNVMKEVNYIWWDEGKPTRIKTTDGYEYKMEEEPFILLQYIGIKDKNGIEIYDGDVIKRLDIDGMESISYLDAYFNPLATLFSNGITEVIDNIYKN